MSAKRDAKEMDTEDESPTPKRAKENLPSKKEKLNREGGREKGRFEEEQSEEDEPEQEDDLIVEAREQMTYPKDDVVVIYDVAYMTTEDDKYWGYEGNDITFVRTSEPHLNSIDVDDGRPVYKMFLRMRTLELDGEGPCGGFWLCKSSDEKTWDDFHLEYQTPSYGDQVDNNVEHSLDDEVDEEKDSFFDFSLKRDDNGYKMLSFVLSLAFWGNASMQISGWAKRRVATRLTKRERAMLRALDGGLAGLGDSDDEMTEEKDEE